MSNITILRGILLATIALSLTLSSIKVNGQNLLKKIQDAATRAIDKKNSGKTPKAINQNKSPDTLAVHTDNNKVNSVSVTNPSILVNAVTKEKLDNVSQQHKAGENNSSAQNMKAVFVSISGIDYVQQTPFRNYLHDSATGIYSIQEKALGMTFVELVLNTSLNTDDLVKTVIKTLEMLNPKLYYMVHTANDQMIRMTISNKPLHYVTKETETTVNEKKNGISVAKPVAAENVKLNSDDYDKTFTKVYMEASFPGGADILKVYLQENLNTNVPKKNGAPAGTYTVVVQFIVAKDGSISDVEAVTRPGYGMENEAIRVIAGGPKWEPGRVDGPVKSYKKQPITFIVSK